MIPTKSERQRGQERHTEKQKLAKDKTRKHTKLFLSSIQNSIFSSFEGRKDPFFTLSFHGAHVNWQRVTHSRAPPQPRKHTHTCLCFMRMVTVRSEIWSICTSNHLSTSKDTTQTSNNAKLSALDFRSGYNEATNMKAHTCVTNTSTKKKTLQPERSPWSQQKAKDKEAKKDTQKNRS